MQTGLIIYKGGIPAITKFVKRGFLVVLLQFKLKIYPKLFQNVYAQISKHYIWPYKMMTMNYAEIYSANSSCFQDFGILNTIVCYNFTNLFSFKMMRLVILII